MNIRNSVCGSRAAQSVRWRTLKRTISCRLGRFVGARCQASGMCAVRSWANAKRRKRSRRLSGLGHSGVGANRGVDFARRRPGHAEAAPLATSTSSSAHPSEAAGSDPRTDTHADGSAHVHSTEDAKR